jgi:hypothetical protein
MTTDKAAPRLARCGALLLVVASWPLTSHGAGGLVPQHTEDLRPTLTRASRAGDATLAFTAYGRDFRVQLSENLRLSRLAAGGGVRLYKGTLEAVPNSWARISIRDGLPRGMIWDGHELFIVEAAADTVNYGAAGTVMFKLSDAALEPGASFADEAIDVPGGPAAAYDSLVGELRARTRALQAGEATEGVRISILGDPDYLGRYSSEAEARDAILTRMNSVDGIFSSQVGVELQVESVNLARDASAGLSASTDPGTLLEELAHVRQGNSALSATGLTHLFTGRRLNGQTTGIAYRHALCSRRFGASLAMAHSSAALDALITAHEIGHVFGAPHDGTERCASTPQGQYIMTPTFNGTSITSFSQCSLDQIDAVLDSYACVVDLPPTDPEPPPTPPPSPPPGDGGTGGGGDSGGGGGSLDPSLLLLLVALGAARLPRTRRPFIC